MNQQRNDVLASKLSKFLNLSNLTGRWVCCEWFYSDIDKVIFESENDFSLCIKQSFPRLKTRNLSRKQWCILRSLIGKPRRCSDAFFQEERHMLEDKRQKIRLIQQRKVSERELNEFKDIPQEIPLPLSIGHRVYAHICHPQDGVYLGTIAAVDPIEHTYRVVFDRPDIGSQTIPDYEIKSETPTQTVPIKVYVQTYRPKATPQLTPHKYIQTLFDEHNGSNLTNNLFDPLLTGTNANNILSTSFNLNETSESQQFLNNISSGGLLGGFPVRLLVLITRLNKILNVKRDYIRRLNDLNREAECIKATRQQQHLDEDITETKYSREFQISYATLIINIEKLNKDLSDYINGVQNYCEQFAPDLKVYIERFNLNQTLSNNQICKTAYTDASEIVDRLNKNFYDDEEDEGENEEDAVTPTGTKPGANTANKILKSNHITQLITQLTSLMLQIKEYSNQQPVSNKFQISDANSPDQSSSNDNNNNTSTNEEHAQQFQSQQTYFNTQSINITIEDIKKNYIFNENCKLFEDKVEVHLNHIQSCLNNFNKLNPFKKFNETNEKFLFKQD